MKKQNSEGMDSKNTKEKKSYSKPQIEKHKALALISGSGGDDCNLYSSKQDGLTYYH